MRKSSVIIFAAIMIFIFSGSLLAAPTTYTVTKGDTMYGIAKANNITVDQLMKYNNLTSAGIYIGQNLVVKTSGGTVVSGASTAVVNTGTSVSSATATQTVDKTPVSTSTSETSSNDVDYVVVKGDTSSTIAQKYGITVSTLVSANKLSNGGSTLFVGQKLIVPNAKVTTTNTTETASRNEERRDTEGVTNLTDYAKTFIGTPYIYGANGPDAFDCSGFTKYVFNKFGVNLPRVSRDQAKVGVEVSKESLLTGDLIFFASSGYQIGHVGIYIGDNNFIHASTSKTGVIISKLDSAYYISNYVTARRVELN